ncbi:MAG: hypothetical protein WBW41_06160 [Verrucomicrobiia bacterium]
MGNVFTGGDVLINRTRAAPISVFRGVLVVDNFLTSFAALLKKFPFFAHDHRRHRAEGGKNDGDGTTK